MWAVQNKSLLLLDNAPASPLPHPHAMTPDLTYLKSRKPYEPTVSKFRRSSSLCLPASARAGHHLQRQLHQPTFSAPRAHTQIIA